MNERKTDEKEECFEVNPFQESMKDEHQLEDQIYNEFLYFGCTLQYYTIVS